MVYMKPIELYKDAVMRRAEDKKTARRKAQKRVLAVCVPLCLCLVIASVTVFPKLLPAPETGNGTTCETLEATVSHGSSAWTLSDADELYLTLQDLCKPVDPESDPESILNDGSDGESIPDGSLGGVPETAGTTADDNKNGTVHSYRITLSNDSSYLLMNKCLTDLASGEEYWLTDEELKMLMNLLEP